MHRGRIVSLRVLSLRLPMRLAFRHHQATRRESRPQIVELRLDDETTGFGEAQPRPYVTGETEESVREGLTGPLAQWLVGQEVPDLGSAAALLTGPRAAMLREEMPAAWGAVDLAVLDAAGKRSGRSAAEVLGGLRRPGFLSDGAVAGMMPLTALGLFAAHLRKRDKRWIKVKVGGADDAARVETVRRVLGPRIEITLDANGAWAREEAVARVKDLARFGIAAVEQPVDRGDLEGLAEVSARTGIPVIADESLCTRRNALDLIRRNPAIQWNLRVGKCGGLLGVRELLQLATEHGVACQLGVMVGETAILRAAGRLVAGTAADLSRIENDEGLMLARDVTAGHPIPEPDSTWVKVPTEPGLGAQVDAEAVRLASLPVDRAPRDVRGLPLPA